MVELLGILLALLIFGAGAALWRAWQALRRLVMAGRGGTRRLRLPEVRLRLSRRVRQAQASRITALTAELERTRRLLRLAERERDALRAARGAGPVEGRFLRAKRAFALHFHPDRLRGHPEARVRRRIFQEFWGVLQRIERS